ncbi:MAG TPA: hypothetical protein VFS67_37400 [Polyangiaceae bacterium]|nr:hypothetical protein [Polyangiaceae bacterium]
MSTDLCPSMCPSTPAAAPGGAGAGSTRDDLYRNQDGAIMVIGVFIAIVLVGLLFYVSGVASACFRHERMQDAADAVALATAIGHARGMNLIVFINLVMAALVAILLALKLIELMLTALELILAAISWFVPPAAGAIPVVDRARSFVHDVHDTAKDIIDNILIGLNMAERAIAYITPAQSVLMGTTKVTENYQPTVDFAIGIPTRISLPVENDTYNVLCDRAEIVLKGLIDWATDPIPFIGKVISMAMGALLTGVKHAYCYHDQEAPSADVEITRMLPLSAAGRQCEEDKANLNPGEACSQWEQELLERHPESNGDCVDASSDRDRSALCKGTLVEARQRCQPGVEKDITSYSWSEQEVEEHVVFDTTTWSWRRTEYKYVEPPDPTTHNTSTYSDALAASQNESRDFGESELDQKSGDKGVPCQNPYIYYRDDLTPPPDDLWSEWNVQTTWEEFPGVTRPVCDKRQKAVKDVLPNGGEIPPETPDHSLPAGFNPAGYTLRYPAVKQVYGCTQKGKLQMKFPDEWSSTAGSQNDDDKVPQKVEEGVELGSEDFQIRGIAAHFGQQGPNKAERGLFHGAFDRQVAPESWVEAARIADKIAVAQAEYYFNHNGVDNADRKEWMWHMDWRARLVRFRMPGGDDNQQQNNQQQPNDMSLASLGSVAGEDLNIDIGSVDLQGAPSLDSIGELIVH